jgi:hypothetical protein
MSEADIHIDKGFKGRLTELGLLRAQGTVQIEVYPSIFNKDYCIFQLRAEGFYFGLGVLDGCLHFHRNEVELKIPFEDLKETLAEKNLLIASWGPSGLLMGFGGIDHSKPIVHKEISAPISMAPSSLIKIARMRSLIPVTIFDSENHFLSRVHSSLQSLESKFLDMATPNIFWDIGYEGSKITSRKPKREVDLHPFVGAVLADQMMLSSIDVMPEATLASGRLDFLFTGAVKDQGLARCMVEFKNAHASDLIHGIELQLPDYMASKGVDHGAYCVFDFRGRWFDQPADSLGDIQMKMIAALLRAKLPSSNAIKFYFYQLGKRESSSKIK